MTPAEEPVLGVELAPGLSLRNPVMIASGTFGWDGYGLGLGDSPALPGVVDIQRLGAVVAKTVTMRPRVGNPEPRWYPSSWRRALQAGEHLLLNSIGLTNPGLEITLKEQAPMWNNWEVPVLLSIAGESVAEFGKMAAQIEGTPGIDGLELNLSCPNVDNGASFALEPELTRDTVQTVKANSTLPVLAKLAPNVPDITAIAQAAEEGGADAITICNTLPALKIDIESRTPVLGSGAGGISGVALHPVAVALVHRAAGAVEIPVIGVGGVFNAEDAVEFLLAGARAIQIGSANLANFWAPLDVLDGLVAYMGEHGVADVNDLVGAVELPARA